MNLFLMKYLLFVDIYTPTHDRLTCGAGSYHTLSLFLSVPSAYPAIFRRGAVAFTCSDFGTSPTRCTAHGPWPPLAPFARNC